MGYFAVLRTIRNSCRRSRRRDARAQAPDEKSYDEEKGARELADSVGNGEAKQRRRDRYVATRTSRPDLGKRHRRDGENFSKLVKKSLENLLRE